eukprot:948552-Rhodomonas_salina.3
MEADLRSAAAGGHAFARERDAGAASPEQGAKRRRRRHIRPRVLPRADAYGQRCVGKASDACGQRYVGSEDAWRV